jgi:hypothetical protein
MNWLLKCRTARRGAKRAIVASSVCAILVAAAGDAGADTYTFTPQQGDCGDAMLWQPMGAPSQGDDVILDGVAQNCSFTNIKSLTIQGAAGISGGVVTIQAGGSMTWQGGTLDSVTLTLPAGVTTTISGNVSIAGGSIANAGTIQFLQGTFAGGDGAILNNTGTLIVAPGTQFTAGVMDALAFLNNQAQGTIQVVGPGTSGNSSAWRLDNFGTIAFTSGAVFDWTEAANVSTHMLENGSVLSGDGTLLVDQGGVMTLVNQISIGTGTALGLGTGGTLEAIGGMTPGATLMGPGAFVWTGGSIVSASSAEQITWAPNLGVHLTGTDSKILDTGYVVNLTSVLWDQGNLSMGDAASFINAGTFTVEGDLVISGLTGGNDDSAIIDNQGTFLKDLGSGQLLVQTATFHNQSKLEVTSGNLLFQGPDQGGGHMLEAGSSIVGPVAFTCAVQVDGASTVASGANLSFTADAQGNFAVVTGNGSLGGPGTVTLSGATINAVPSLDFEAGGNVVIAPNVNRPTILNPASQTDPVTFSGTTAWTGGAALEIAGPIVNKGTWTTNAASQATVTGQVLNQGTFVVDPGSGKSVEMTPSFQNAGLVDIRSGKLWLDATPFTQLDGELRLDGGDLWAHDTNMPPQDYYPLALQGGSLTGSGTVDAILDSFGSVSPGTSTGPGQITVTQACTLESSATLAVSLAGTGKTEFGSLTCGGDVTLDGRMTVALVGGYVPMMGDMYQVVTSMGADPDMGQFTNVTPPTGVTVKTTYDPMDVVLGIETVNLPDGGSDGGVNDGGSEGGMNDGGGDGGVDDVGVDGGGQMDAGAPGSGDAGGGAGSASQGGGCSMASTSEDGTSACWLAPAIAVLWLARRGRRR